MPEDLAPDPTPDEFAKWLRPSDALKMLSPIGEQAAVRELLRRLGTGRIIAAGSCTWGRNSENSEDRVTIPKSWWGDTSPSNPGDDLWRVAGINFRPSAQRSYGTEYLDYRYFGVRFDREGVRTALADAGLDPAEADHSSESAPAVAVAKHPGGAPPKPWWDDLWVEMFRQIWEAELQPTAMSHIADAMLQWASDHGHQLSESTAKRAARKLWAVAKPEGS